MQGVMEPTPLVELPPQPETLVALVEAQKEIAAAGPGLDEVLSAACEQAVLLTGASGAVVELAEGDELVWRAGAGTLTPHVGERLALESSFARLALRSGQVIMCDDVRTDARADHLLYRRLGVRSIITVGLEPGDEKGGALTVAGSERDAFSSSPAQAMHTAQMLRLLSTCLGLQMARGGLVAARESALAELRRLENRHHIAMAMLDEGVVVFDEHGQVAYSNNAAGRILGLSFDQLAARHSRDPRWGLVHPDGAPWPVDTHPAAVTRETGRTSRDVIMGVPRADGSLTWIMVTSRVLPAELGQPSGVVMTFSDVTEHRITRGKLEHEAHHDQLTGLPNRRLFDLELDSAIARAQRHGQAVALVYVDLNRFKQINDTMGHRAGDIVLRTIAERFGATVRDGELMTRYGGDEFVALLTGITQPARVLEAFTQRLQAALADPIPVEEGTIRVGASFGSSVYPHDGRTVEELLAHADAAMLSMKGRLVA